MPIKRQTIRADETKGAWKPVEKKTCTIVIELEILGDPSDAYDVVNSVLDGGDFQDAINNSIYWPSGSVGIFVESATVMLSEPRKA